MEKKEIFTGIGIAILIIIIGYSIALFIYFENTIPGAGIELSMAQVLFIWQLVYIIPIGLLGIGLIYKENIEIKVREFLANNLLTGSKKLKREFMFLHMTKSKIYQNLVKSTEILLETLEGSGIYTILECLILSLMPK